MSDDEKRDFEQLKRDVEDLQRANDNPHMEIDTDVFGLFETVSVAPTTVPKIMFDQVKLYKSGNTVRLYVFDANNGAWRFANLS